MTTPSTPVSPQPPAFSSKGCVAGFAIFLMLLGALIFVIATARPLWQMSKAAKWEEVPCRIISSRVRHMPANRHGSTYGIDIHYSYRFGGHDFEGLRYDFSSGTSSAYAGKQAVVATYPPGRQTVCFVDPLDPTQAVLSRGLPREFWQGIIGLALFFAGFFWMKSGAWRRGVVRTVLDSGTAIGR
jgi:Protein of unknown function (DUF3592)